jgi:3-oxosteroid 1-dehydrogenase
MDTNERYDVIVLGTGIAGLATALAAATNRLRVLVIEKAEEIGGGTTESYGLLWAGNNHLSRLAGYEDSRDDTLAYMKFVGGGETSDEHLSAYVDSAPDAVKFFADCGIPFHVIKGLADHYVGMAPGARKEGRSFEVDLISGFDLGEWRERVRTPPTQPYFLTAEEQINWGGINRLSYWDQELVKRRQADDMRGKGVGLICQFLKALLALHVPIRLGERVERLILDDGRVTGVRTNSGEEIGVTRGVVLATGGYESNPEMTGAFEGLPGWRSLYPSSVAGDGFVLGCEVGAAVHVIRTNLQVMMGFEVPVDHERDPIHIHTAGIVELCSPHTLVVNRAGKRFFDEAYFQSMVGAIRQFDAMTHSHVNLPAFLIFDSQYAEKYSFADRPAGAEVPAWVHRDATVSGLAAKLGISSQGLEATIARFNGFARAGRDEDFHRGELEWRLANVEPVAGQNRTLGPLEQSPFYGIELHPAGGGSAGLLTNARAQVLHQRKHPIPGLYAVGNTAAKLEFGSGYQAGFTLTSGMTFGYLAAQHMLQDAGLLLRGV